MSKILLLLLLLIPVNLQAATITLPVFNDNAASQTGYVRFAGVPIHVDDSSTTTSDFKITSDSAGTTQVDAQFEVISRYDEDNDGADVGDKIRTVMCVFEATVGANSSTDYYLQINPGSGTGGDVAGTDIISDETGYHQIATGALTAQITESAGFNIFDVVTVDATNVVSSPATDGVIIVSGGTTYTSYNSNNAPTLEIIYNGPLFAMMKASAHVEDATNNTLIPPTGTPASVNPIAFDVFYWVYKNSRTVDVGFRLKNENPGGIGVTGGTNRNIELTSLGLKTTLSGLGTITEIDFDDWAETTSPSGDYWINQEHCLPGSCAQASEADTETTPNFNYYIKEGSTVRNTDGHRFDSYAQMRDANRGLMIAQEYMWENWPNSINLDATNKEAIVYLLPIAAADHMFLAAAWKYWHVTYNFHANVAESYDFTSELADVKKPLKVLLGDQVATSEFFGDKTAPVNFTITGSGGGSESIDTAKQYWEASVLQRFDDSYARDSSTMSTFTEMRENRPVSSTSGVFNGPIDMYGWLPFGDFVDSTYLMGALTYNWNYLAVLNGHRHQRYDVSLIGEQMSIKTVDQLFLHAPVDDGSSAGQGSGATVRYMHGSHRDESDADTKGKSYINSVPNNGTFTLKHGHLQGAILEYMLSGKPWLLDGMKDVGDLIRYLYGGMAPDHGQFGVLGYPTYDCVTGSGSAWTNFEPRSYARVMGVAVSMYEATGDIDYYNIAKGIFTNVLLNDESPASPGTLLHSPTLTWYSLQPFKFATMLYEEANTVGDTTTATAVSSYLVRVATWLARAFEEDNKCTLGAPGDYNDGVYCAYAVYTMWDETAGWSDAVNPTYTLELPDIFAFAYKATGNNEWLIRARDSFKTPFYYSLTLSEASPIEFTENTTALGALNFLPTNVLWMKDGKQVVRSMGYLNTEYKQQFRHRGGGSYSFQ